MDLFCTYHYYKNLSLLKHLLRIIYEEYYLEPFTILSDQNSFTSRR